MDENESDTFGNRCRSFWINHYEGVLILLIPVAFLPILFIDLKLKLYRVLYLYCIMSFYWITRVIPIYITALFPAMLLPFMGVLDSNTVCMLYTTDDVILFLGLMLMSLAIQYSNLDKRIALGMLLFMGNNPKKLLWFIIFITMFFSMFLTNTATTVLMFTITRAVLDDLDAQGIIKAYEEPDKTAKDDQPKASSIASCFFISIAFASNIGGTGTLLGTSTNIAFKGIYDVRFKKSEDYINFLSFLVYSLPMVIILTLFLCMWMHLLFCRNIEAKNIGKKLAEDDKSAIRLNYAELKQITAHEIQVIILFILMLSLFFSMRSTFMSGWNDLFKEHPIKNSWPVILIGLLLFTLPNQYKFCRYLSAKGPHTEKETSSLLSWKYMVKNMPWGFVLLIGGGLALTEGIVKSELSLKLIQEFSRFAEAPNWSIQLSCIIIVVFLTAIAWNITAVCMTIPIISDIAIACGIHPLYLIFPSGLAASYSFLTPFGTPPNEYVISQANISAKKMFIAGIGPTIVAILLVFANGNTWHRIVFPEFDKFPKFAALEGIKNYD